MSPSRKRGKAQSPNSRAKKKHKRLDAISDRPLPSPPPLLPDPSSSSSPSDDDDDEDEERLQLRRSSRARRAPQVLDSSPVPSNRRRKKKDDQLTTIAVAKKKESSVSASLSFQEEENEEWRSRLRARVKSGKAKGKAVAGERSARVSRNGKMLAKRRLIKADRDEEDVSISKELESVRVLRKVKTLKRKRGVEMQDEDLIKTDRDEENEDEEEVESEGREEGGADEDEGKRKATFDLNVLDAEGREEGDGNDDDDDDEGKGKTSSKDLEAEGSRKGDEDEGKEKATSGLRELRTCRQAEEIKEIAMEVGASPEIETEKIVDGEKVKTDETASNNANNNAVTSEKSVKESDMASPMSDNKLSSTRVKEGRRCGLCGGGTDGKPPKKLVRESVDSDNEAYEGSSASEEPNYDVWDGFGDEPGWLGKLLGPIHDRFGIARVWVHQHCAVWSPEVHSLF